jgi:hypothetical protein
MNAREEQPGERDATLVERQRHGAWQLGCGDPRRQIVHWCEAALAIEHAQVCNENQERWIEGQRLFEHEVVVIEIEAGITDRAHFGVVTQTACEKRWIGFAPHDRRVAHEEDQRPIRMSTAELAAEDLAVLIRYPAELDRLLAGDRQRQPEECSAGEGEGGGQCQDSRHRVSLAGLRPAGWRQNWK